MEKRHSSGLVWPIILIAAGVVLLLNNLGVLSWDIWGSLWRLWPLLLIASGLELLFGQRSRWVSALVALLFLAALFFAVRAGPNPWHTAGTASEAHTESIQEPRRGAESAAVTIAYGVGELRVAALNAKSPDLLRGTADLAAGETLRINHTGDANSDGERLTVRSESRGLTPGAFNSGERVWDFALSRDIPLQLQVEGGVGRMALDLTQLALTQFNLQGGVGESTIKLPATGEYEVDIDGGVGQITVLLPPALGVRLVAGGGLGAVDVAGDFERHGDEYRSRNYASATHRATIQIDGGVGRITVRQVTE